MSDLLTGLELVLERGGSDLLLKAGGCPLVRINGELDCLDPAQQPLESWGSAAWLRRRGGNNQHMEPLLLILLVIIITALPAPPRTAAPPERY